ncbi:hypothetical protein CHARACLAT_018809 [Characodon lateralis]|uniref:Uncharacterized protein n=1 Tax=Characodon lateralis TaxID=208331 RepID=A0ABU7EKC5_9TELE|nr:hypothetical protein [Characodon lateralis]
MPLTCSPAVLFSSLAGRQCQIFESLCVSRYPAVLPCLTTFMITFLPHGFPCLVWPSSDISRFWITTLFLPFDFCLLPHPWICLPEPAPMCLILFPCLNTRSSPSPLTSRMSLPSWLSTPLLITDHRVLDNPSVGHPTSVSGALRTVILGRLLPNHYSAEDRSLVPCSTRTLKSGYWSMVGGFLCSYILVQNKSFNTVLCLWLKFQVFCPDDLSKSNF